MNLFESLPDEKLLEICEQMDDKSLSRISQVYSRVYKICYDIIQSRKQKHNENIRIQKTVDEVFKMYKETPEIQIELSKYHLLHFKKSLIREYIKIDYDNDDKNSSILTYLFPRRASIYYGKSSNQTHDYAVLNNSTDEDVRIVLVELTKQNIL